MAIIYACSFDHYGLGEGETSKPSSITGLWQMPEVMLGDGWTDHARFSGSAIFFPSGVYRVASPAWGARQGERALIADSVELLQSGYGGALWTIGGEASLRFAIPGASRSTRLIHFAFSCSEMPPGHISGRIMTFMDSDSGIMFELAVDPSGRLQLWDNQPITVDSGVLSPKPNVLLSTAAPVIQAATWHFFSIKIHTGVSDTDIEVYMGNDLASPIMAGTIAGIANNIDMLGLLAVTVNYTTDKDHTTRAIRDLVICDDTGTYNNSLLGECFVSAQEMRMEEPGGGWESNPRQMIAGGIFRTRRDKGGSVSYLRFSDHASTELGTNDFTVESWVRFSSKPGSSDVWNFLAKWSTNNANRSWRLVYYGSDKTLRWEVSTNGSAGITVKQVPWEPILHHWYHVAVSRESGVTRMFIDGFEMGAGTADANGYFNGTAFICVGCRFLSNFNNPATDESFDGFMDEVRVTNGVSRYNADFVPDTAPFGRNTTDDPDFLNVGLLLGFDNNGNADESQYSHQPLTGLLPDPPPPLNPEDGDYTFRVLNGAPPIDDTYIEAPLTRATGVFTFLGLPTAADEIDINGTVYTWVASVSSAYDVKIGASVNDCIDNLVSAINADAGAGTKYGSGTLAHPDVAADASLSPQVWLTATVVGTSGNAVTTTTTMADGKFRKPTLTGGKDLPVPSDFAIERLPVDVTGILGVQMTTRAYKTDAGAASMRIDLVGPGGSVALGADYSPDLNPQWGRQIFEEDPDTSAGLTPSTMIGGRARFVRTV